MKVLMVCLGNICRSPMAQGILEDKCNKENLDWKVDSAGTSAWHIGEQADPRSISTSIQNGINISHQRARQFSREDLVNFDLILAMDSTNYQNILSLDHEKKYHDKVKLILNYAYPGQNRSVPDPYYNDGFDTVFEMLDRSCDELIGQITGSKRS